MGLRARFFVLFFAHKCLIIPLSLVANTVFHLLNCLFLWHKEMQKSKMTVWGGLTNSCEKKRREKQRKKGKIYLFECKSIARRYKKGFLSHQCKEIEENNRMGKTRDLFRKIRYQGNISCKDGHNEEQKFYGLKGSRRY